MVRLGPLGKNSPAILLQASLLFLVSETLSYPPSSLTRFHRRKRSMFLLPTLGSRSKTVLALRQQAQSGKTCSAKLTRASRGTSPMSLGVPRVLGRVRRNPTVCLAPCLLSRVYPGLVRCLSRDMHGTGGVPGAMGDCLFGECAARFGRDDG